jgi:hypothetical protein
MKTKLSYSDKRQPDAFLFFTDLISISDNHIQILFTFEVINLTLYKFF